jgi:hypothetical protein
VSFSAPGIGRAGVSQQHCRHVVFYELSEGHREAVTEKLKSDIEQLRDDFAKAHIKPPDDMVEFFELPRDAKQSHSGDREVKAAEKSAK